MLVGDNSYAVLDLLHCCQSLRYPDRQIASGRRPVCASATPSTWPERSPAIEGPAASAAESFPCADGCNLGQRRGGLVRRHHPRRGTHLPDGGLVPLRQAPVLIRWVLIRDPQGSFATQALLCTDPAADPTQILEWFVLRWQLEVTFHEVRTHLGVETQWRADAARVYLLPEFAERYRLYCHATLGPWRQRRVRTDPKLTNTRHNDIVGL